MAAFAALGLVGCGKGSSESELKPEGNPEVLQVFVIDADGTSKMAFGTHPDIVDDPTDDLTPQHTDQAGPVENAIVFGNRIRIVVDELLRGSSVEQFACACFAGGGCDTIGFTFNGTEVDVAACTTCDDNANTTDVNETGLCYDGNADVNGNGIPDGFVDGIPDMVFLQEGIVTLNCGGNDIPIEINEGWYNPSGNQQIPTALGTDAIGPALVLNPFLLPTNADCGITIATTVVDKDGNAIPMPSGTIFHTEPMVVLGSAPEDGATGVDGATFELTAQFNTLVGAATVTVDNGVTGTVVVMDDTIVFTPDAPLAADTAYTATITTATTDTFGSELPADYTIAFTTAP